jgi:hypothetical protein
MSLFVSFFFVYLILAQSDIGSLEFACSNMGASTTVPTTVNRIRPADIKVLAAMGHSLTVETQTSHPLF